MSASNTVVSTLSSSSSSSNQTSELKSNNNNNITESAQQQLCKISLRTKQPLTQEEELARQIVPKLASRSYHLPGNTLCQDYIQYMLNNHPVLGICCHHRWHPLKIAPRLVILLGSFAFGVAITNVIYLWFVSSGRDVKEEVFSIQFFASSLASASEDVVFSNSSNSNLTSQDAKEQAFDVDLSSISNGENESSMQTLSLTTGLLVLVTVGSGLHAFFDRFVWFLSACGCCQTGGRFESRSTNGCRNLGRYLVVFIVMLVIALATFVVVLRTSLEEGQSHIPVIHNKTVHFSEILDLEVKQIQTLSLLKGYAVEFVVSLFVFYPLIATIFFSGILGCFRVPVFGGRPAEMKKARIPLQRRSNEKCACAATDDVVADVV